MDLGIWSGVDWVASQLFLEKQNRKKKQIVKDCEYFGKRSGHVSRCNFYFVALLVFLVWQSSIRFQLVNCNILEANPIDSTTRMYQPLSTPF